MGRPPFADDYPQDPELDALVEAFDAGDYRSVRDRAPALAEKADDARVRAAARDLRARLDPDPWAVRMLWLTAALLVGLTLYWTVFEKGDHPAPERARPSPSAPSP